MGLHEVRRDALASVSQHQPRLTPIRRTPRFTRAGKCAGRGRMRLSRGAGSEYTDFPTTLGWRDLFA